MRLLLVEDEPNVAGFITKGFREETFAVDHVSTFAEGLERALNEAYDVLVVDRRLPGGDGIEVCRRARKKGVSTPIVILSALADLEARVAGLEAGADDYLAKPFAFSELLARVRALLRRSRMPVFGVLKHGDLELDPSTRRIRSNGARLTVTPREFALLEMFLRKPDATFSRTMIGESVWDYSFSPGSNVIDVYVRRLRKKIEAAGGATTIETARGIGYMLTDEESVA